MTVEEQKSILDKLESYVNKDTGVMSQADFARKLGISQATVSNLRKGTYGASPNEMLAKISEYFNNIEASQKLPGRVRPYVQTTISTEIYEYIRNCHLSGEITYCTGDAGIGKTRTAKQYCLDHPNSAFHVPLDTCNASMKSALRELGKALGAHCGSAQPDAIRDAIMDKLPDGSVIILDEAQHLSFRATEAFRGIFDRFNDNDKILGIAMLGNHKVIDRMTGAHEADFAQQSNRGPLHGRFHASQVTRKDIQLLFPDIQEHTAIDFLWRIAKSVRSFRGAVGIYRKACESKDISCENLMNIAAMSKTKY